MTVARADIAAGSRWHRLELILILGALTAFGAVSTDMYLPAMPAIARNYGVASEVVAHTMASYFLGFALGQAFFGPIADRFGRKPPLYVGIVVYIVACGACAVSNGVESLVVARFVQALAACCGGVIARAAVRDLFTTAEMPGVFAAMMLVLGVAPLFAPFVGGYFLIWFGWRAIFWAQGAFGALVLAAVTFRLKESHGGAHRPLHPFVIARDYYIILKDRRFIGFVLAAAFSNAGMFAYITASPHVFIDLFHVPAQDFGWLFGINGAGLIFAAQLPARLMGRIDGARLMLALQGAQMIAGLSLLVAALLGGGLWSVMPFLFAFVALNGAVMPTASALAMRHFPLNAGMASALMGTLYFGAGVVVAGALGELPARNAVPMAAVIAACAVTAIACRLFLRPLQPQ
jgi:DHA1 family bicyclomycin/chloramphenicol resistance-like MFS transporter